MSLAASQALPGLDNGPLSLSPALSRDGSNNSLSSFQTAPNSASSPGFLLQRSSPKPPSFEEILTGNAVQAKLPPSKPSQPAGGLGIGGLEQGTRSAKSNGMPATTSPTRPLVQRQPSAIGPPPTSALPALPPDAFLEQLDYMQLKKGHVSPRLPPSSSSNSISTAGSASPSWNKSSSQRRPTGAHSDVNTAESSGASNATFTEGSSRDLSTARGASLPVKPPNRPSSSSATSIATVRDHRNPTSPSAEGTSVDRDRPNSRRRTSTLSNTMSGDALTSPTSAHRGVGDMSSKSVLTVALQKAQSAVLLDTPGNEEAAMAAYLQSVHLLKEVMIRVDESTGSWRAKEEEKLQSLRTRRKERQMREQYGEDWQSRHSSQSRPPLEDDETDQERRERLRREQKLEKREKSRQDESRRLKTIHDTYNERIDVLKAEVQARQAGPYPRSSGSNTATTGPVGTTQTNTVHQSSQKYPNGMSESPGLGYSSSLHHRGTVNPRESALPFPSGSPKPGKHVRQMSAAGHRDGQLINAVQSSSPPQIALPELGRTPLLADRSAASPLSASSSGSSQPQIARHPQTSRDLDRSMLEFSPDSSSAITGFRGDSNRPAANTSPRIRTTTLESSPSKHRKTMSSSSTSSARSLWSRISPPMKTVPQTPQSAIAGTSPKIGHKASHVPEDSSFDTLTPTPDTASFQISPAIPANTSPQLARTIQHRTTESKAPADSAQTQSRSHSDSISGTRASQARAASAAENFLAANDPAETHSRALNGHDSRVLKDPSLPPLRSHDPAKHHRTSAAGRHSETEARQMLVNPTTTLGTISQRRRSPNPADDFASRGSAFSDDVNADTRSSASAGPTDIVPFDVSGSLPLRLRAISQPVRRPSIASHASDVGPVPPLPLLAVASAPGMTRADSDPLAIAGSVNGRILSGVSVNESISSHDQSAAYASSVSRANLSVSSLSFLDPETPVSATFAPASPEPSNSNISTTYRPPPADVARRPFYFMQQLCESMQVGGYLTPRLYIPRGLWSQNGVKLLHVETKVRALDTLLSAFEGLERAGQGLLRHRGSAINAHPVEIASTFARELESFDIVCDEIQAILSRKLGYIESSGGRKSGASGFGSLSSKFSRSMGKMKNKNLDAPETYVAAIARVCSQAQLFDRHLAAIRGPSEESPLEANQNSHRRRTQGIAAEPISPHTLYSDVDERMRQGIINKLKRTSDFFGKVICRVLLTDLGVWLDKHSKKAAGWTIDT